MLKILIDADMIVYRACANSEHEINWNDTGNPELDFWTLHSEVAETIVAIDSLVKTLVNKVLKHTKYNGEYKIIMCISDSENFRKTIYPLYKANRIGKRKPVCYAGTMEWLRSAYDCFSLPTLEADDCIGILATEPDSNCVIVSADKDFLTIPAPFYNMGKDLLTQSTVEEAERFHMWQILVGDTADNYCGCPSIGSVTADKVLDDPKTQDLHIWERVVSAFVKKKLKESDAILMGQVSRILHWSDYDMKTGEIKLWQPPTIKM